MPDTVQEMYMKTMQQMYEYYQSQPACLKHIFDDRKWLTENFVDFYVKHRPDRIYMIGSGSSLNACKAAQAFLEHILGVEVTVAAPSNPPIISGETPLIMVVSQGGRSSNTIAYLAEQHAKGYLTASFTAGLDVPIAKMADIATDIGVGDEKVGPKTIGYTGTVLCLYLAALEAALASSALTDEAYAHETALLKETIEYGEDNLKRCETFYKRHAAALKTATHFLFVGKGCAAAVGAEDALKVLETLCYPSSGYEFEEYLHGPACCTDERTALFLFYSDDVDGPRMEKLAGITAKATQNSYIIDHTSKIEGENVLNLRSGNSPYVSPFVDAYFGQLLSALLTQALGRTRHEAVREIFGDMHTKITTDAPYSKETR